MRVYLILEYLLLTGYSSYAQEENITGGLTKASERLDNYENNMLEPSKVAESILTDEHHVHDITDNNTENFNKKELTVLLKHDTHIIATDNATNQTTTANILSQLRDNKFYFSKRDYNTSSPRAIMDELTCHIEIDDICSRIGELKKVPCGDGTIIPLYRLCDDSPDCLNGTDEINCKQRVGDKIKEAVEILLVANNICECLPRNLEGGQFSDEFQHWQKALHTDWVLYDSYGDEITTTISSIFSSFESHVCTPIDHIDLVTDDYLKLEDDLDNLIAGVNEVNNWSPVSCICKRQYCKSDYCDGRCKRICWQVYSLNHWTCQSVTGEISISLDFICDGKIDCVDETDEKSCMKESFTYKHNADIIYNELMKTIISVAKSRKYKFSMIGKLLDLINVLQVLTVKTPNPNIITVKTFRNEYFKQLVEIFKDVWSSSILREINYAHDFLLSLNKKMIKALKRSYTGNKYILSYEKCNCKDNVCASLVCSRKCNIFCSAEPVLTRYVCDNDTTYLSLDAVCDGTAQCVNGEDEEDCKYYVCRTRHLDKLRINIQNAEKLLTDYGVTKVPDWNHKIAQILEIGGNIDPIRHILIDKVSQVLHELTVMYASMAEASKNSELNIQGFIEASNVIKQTLRTCGVRADGN